MAVSTVGEFLSALEKSKLLSSEQLVAAQRLAAESSDAAALAKALARENLISRWQAGTLLALGQRAQLRLGKYKLIQRLGKGGMGTVFLAEHVTMNRRVALKIVPRSIAENRASLDRFFAEARAIAALDHPNIVQAYSVDNEMDRYFIVMEYVDGQDLQRLVELDGPLDFDHAADFIRQAADGLAHAHAHNLVHCDIKPSNLLVNNQGVIKILDLGLARLKQGNEPRGATAGEPAFGTVDYMAPEQALETTSFDHRADIYSLGCTLYFLLTGHPPFPEGTLAQRIVKHQTQEPRDLRLERPNTPPKLVEICKRMMAKEPEDRYQAMQEVSTALAPWRDGSDGAGGGSASRAVKPLEDTTSAAAPADDWLSSLGAPPTSTATSSGAKTPALAAAKPTKSGQRRKHKGQPSGGIAATLASAATFGGAKSGWFDTTERKIVGAVGGVLLLAAVAGLASLAFLRSHPKPAPQTAVQQKPEENTAQVEDEVGYPPDKPAETRPDASTDLIEKDAPEGNSEVPKRLKPRPEKPLKSGESDNPASKPEKSASKANVEPALPGKKPESPAKPVSLDGLATAVELPQPGKGADQAVSLGSLDLDPQLTVEVQLFGGDTVAKGNPRFELRKDGDGPTSAGAIQMVEKGKDPVKIARVWQEEHGWKIQWTAEAKDKATLLRYCGLQFSCAEKTRLVALCKPKTARPLLIDFETGIVRARLRNDVPLPDASVLRLQIPPLDPSMPKHEIEIAGSTGNAGLSAQGKPIQPAAENVVPVKGRVKVTLTKDNAPPIYLGIHFLEAHGTDVIIEMRAGCEVWGGAVLLNPKSLQEVADDIAACLLAGDASRKKKGPKPSPEQLQAANKAKDELKALADWTSELKQKAWIPYRVYAVLGRGDAAPQVVIFRSGQFESSKAGGTKKNPKGNKKDPAAP